MRSPEPLHVDIFDVFDQRVWPRLRCVSCSEIQSARVDGWHRGIIDDKCECKLGALYHELEYEQGINSPDRCVPELNVWTSYYWVCMFYSLLQQYTILKPCKLNAHTTHNTQHTIATAISCARSHGTYHMFLHVNHRSHPPD